MSEKSLDPPAPFPDWMDVATRALTTTDPLTVHFMLMYVKKAGAQAAYIAALLAQKPADVAAEWWLITAPPEAHTNAFMDADVAEAVQGRTP